VDLGKLRIFEAVVRAGSFSGAGRRLYLSQPSISAHIRDLEHDVGLPLFERLARGVRLTTAGQSLAEYARRIFSLESDAEQALAAQRDGEVGSLTIAASSTPGTYLLPGILGRFRDEHPGVGVHLVISDTADVERRVGALEADIGVMGEPISPGDLEVRPWADDELVLVCSRKHPWASDPPPDTAALAGQPFVLRELGSSIRALTDRWLADHGIAVQAAMELGSPEAVNVALSAGSALSITSRHAIRRQLALDEVAVLDLPGLPIVRRLNVITNRQRPLLPACRRLLAWILEGR
jgi:DNA-binding transcriptional LysR family regulator